MSTIVYVWVHPLGITEQNPGHCSIEIKGTYISFHPRYGDGFKWNLSKQITDENTLAKVAHYFLKATSARTARLYSYQEDFNEVKRKEEYKIILPDLPNESQINLLRLKEDILNFKYTFAGQLVRNDGMNCVDAVMHCLDKLVGHRLEGYERIIFPQQVANYAQLLQRYFN